MKPKDCVHGTAVCFGKRGVLIRGAPATGKSTLALSLIDSAGYGFGSHLLRAKLVADDQVELTRDKKSMRLSAPLKLRGLIEIRGHGIVKVPHTPSAHLVLIVDLLDAAKIERMPTVDDLFAEVTGLRIPRLMLPVNDSSAPARIRTVLQKL